MKTTLVFATRNRGKVEEMSALLAGLDVELVTLEQAGVQFHVEEDATSFDGNARKKAEVVFGIVGMPTLADDSGLEVDALGGAPGVRSARYAGPRADDAANNARLLSELAAVEAARGPVPRSARFRCCLALAFSTSAPSVRFVVEEGVCEGEILRAPRGTGGFGYDPLFYLEAYGRTLAELSLEEKNRVSHRGQAFHRMAQRLRQAMEQGAWRPA